VPLETQARDALAALRVMRQHPRLAGAVAAAPFGLWGFSQGAWAAPLAASLSPEVRFLILVASTGVTPARQMRYGTVQQVRRAGFGDDTVAECLQLRAAYEEYLRGQADHAATQALIDRLSSRAWFPLVYVPTELPSPGAWRDMDFDPAPIFARVSCPALLFYGEDDEWTPVDESIKVWRRTALKAGNEDLTVVRLPGTSHHPTLHGGRDISSISPLYTETLLRWLAARVAPSPFM
jgi:pimeloyl-ACP methyl ester carboxylesterase